MTIQHAGPFWESTLFKGARRGVMMSLCNHADDFGECYPSYYAMAAEVRCSRRQAMREVEWLARAGAIDIIEEGENGNARNGAKRRSNLYRVNLALVRAVYNLVREAKEAAGRSAAQRWKNALAAADWAEKIIEEEGAHAAVETMRKMMADGDMVSLLQKYNSDMASPSDDANGDMGDEKSSQMSPEPSIEPSIEPSEEPSGRAGARERAGGSPAPGAEAGERGEAGELIERRTERALVEWLVSGRLSREDVLGLMASPPHGGLDRDEAVQFALSTDGAGRKKAESLIAWARDCIDGRPDVKPTGVYPPAERIRHELEGGDFKLDSVREAVERRCALLMGEIEPQAETCNPQPNDNPDTEETPSECPESEESATDSIARETDRAASEGGKRKRAPEGAEARSAENSAGGIDEQI